MAIRFVIQARAIVRQAEIEAANAGAPLIEAEHLLLAMTGEHGAEARDVLVSAGLDREAIRAALDREFRQSLAATGVALPPGGLPSASRDPARRARMATSGKRVLEQALKAAVTRGQIQPGHLLLGVLAAQAGTVPRALALAGVNQADLAARTRKALDQSQP